MTGDRSSLGGAVRLEAVNYMLLLYVEDRAVPGSAEAAAATGALMAFHGELEAQGVLVASDPLAPPRSATTLRERCGRLVVTAGLSTPPARARDGVALLRAPLRERLRCCDRSCR